MTVFTIGLFERVLIENSSDCMVATVDETDIHTSAIALILYYWEDRGKQFIFDYDFKPPLQVA